MPVPTTPVLTVDAVIADAERGVLLIRRARDPFAGCWALPGGFVEVGETVEEACAREAKEETGLAIEPVELLGVYSHPARDPRFHTVSVVFLCRAVEGLAHGGDDAAEARWFADLAGLPLAFDHATILADAGFLAAGQRGGLSARSPTPSQSPAPAQRPPVQSG
jgi:8-oxo-dGTP diphosphatase